MRIHYICPYVDDALFGEYRAALSGRAKISYIKESLLKLGYEISLFSPTKSANNKFSFKRSRSFFVSNVDKHYYPCSFGGNSFISKALSYFLIYFQLFLYLICRVKKGERIILYHSLPDTHLMCFYNRVVNRKIILELEELYSARTQNETKINHEKKLVRNVANAYITVNSVIASKCSIDKQTVVCEGQYGQLVKQEKHLRGADNKINVIYSGIFRDNDDVFIASECGRYLNSDYRLHICGYGDNSTIEKLKSYIEAINIDGAGCKIEFHGSLKQKEYEVLMNKCTIGLCPRLLDDKLSDYEFPSKILAYLSRNLKVVCSPISCVKNSELSSHIIFARSNDAVDFAEAIIAASETNIIDNSALLNNQNDRFLCEIGGILSY